MCRENALYWKDAVLSTVVLYIPPAVLIKGKSAASILL